MFHILCKSFAPKVLRRYTHRYKDYKKVWKKEGILDDWQNLGFRIPSITERWESENNPVTDISRLPKHLKNRKLDILQISQPRELYETTVDYQRATYAFYGEKSEIDPAEVCWPSPKQLELLKDREDNYEDKFTDLINTVKMEKLMKQKAIEEYQNQIGKNLESLPKMIQSYKDRQDKAIKDAEKKEKARQDMIREAREYYGFSISIGDPRMDKFKEMKLLEAKKVAKDAKKRMKLMK